VIKLLSETGIFSLILPIAEAIIFKELAIQKGLFVNKEIFIKPKPSKEPNRMIMEFSLLQEEQITDEFIVYNDDNSQTESYKNITSEFYL
jgi:tRNA1Val (adenine37-N6)-methyltransferase